MIKGKKKGKLKKQYIEVVGKTREEKKAKVEAQLQEMITLASRENMLCPLLWDKNG